MISLGLITVLLVILIFLIWLLIVCTYARRYGTGSPGAAAAGNGGKDRGPTPASTASSETLPLAIVPPSTAAPDGVPTSPEGFDAVHASPAQPFCIAAGGASEATAADLDGGKQNAAACSLRVSSEKEAPTPIDSMMQVPQASEVVAADTITAAEVPLGECVSEGNKPLTQAPATKPAVEPVHVDGPNRPLASVPAEAALAPSQIACFRFPICMPCATMSVDTAATSHEEEMVYIGGGSGNPS